MVRDRTDAGRQLADLLDDRDVEADDVVAVETPPHLSDVGQFYRSFGRVSDEEAMSSLDR